jgi:Zn-finger nucleic acid-binding protein
MELQIAVRAGIEIDYCPNCRGVWLDRGELDKIIERHVQEMQSLMRGARAHTTRLSRRSRAHDPTTRTTTNITMTPTTNANAAKSATGSKTFLIFSTN